jgi:hypothetical protein
MLTLRDIARFRDPRRLWQRLVLYSKRASPLLPWQEAGGFDRIWSIARERTLLTEAAAHTLFNLARHASGLGGAMAEVGVYRGGTARVLAHVARQAGRELHLFDTFSGMPETDLQSDLHTAGDFADTSLESVRRFLSEFECAHLHAGFFPETAEHLRDRSFSFVHIDVDILKSVSDSCDFFYPRMIPGGVIVFDDYAQTSCPGAKIAVDRFFTDKPEPVLHLATSQAIVIKVPPAAPQRSDTQRLDT